MINLLNYLEFRQYPTNFILANELDECVEILFIENGSYNIGYEINKKIYFRKQRGSLSIIGGFQICNKWRFEFIYQTCTIVKAQSIRKENFMKLINKWSFFRTAINMKFYKDYHDKVYLPMIKRKNMDVID